MIPVEIFPVFAFLLSSKISISHLVNTYDVKVCEHEVQIKA